MIPLVKWVVVLVWASLADLGSIACLLAGWLVAA